VGDKGTLRPLTVSYLVREAMTRGPSNMAA
jgi:hypothetical protein